MNLDYIFILVMAVGVIAVIQIWRMNITDKFMLRGKVVLYWFTYLIAMSQGYYVVQAFKTGNVQQEISVLFCTVVFLSGMFISLAKNITK